MAHTWADHIFLDPTAGTPLALGQKSQNCKVGSPMANTGWNTISPFSIYPLSIYISPVLGTVVEYRVFQGSAIPVPKTPSALIVHSDEVQFPF